MNTLFQNDRIRRILSDLHSLMYRHPHPITNVTMTKGQYDNPSQKRHRTQPSRSCSMTDGADAIPIAGSMQMFRSLTVIQAQIWY